MHREHRETRSELLLLWDRNHQSENERQKSTETFLLDNRKEIQTSYLFTKITSTIRILTLQQIKWWSTQQDKNNLKTQMIKTSWYRWIALRSHPNISAISLQQKKRRKNPTFLKLIKTFFLWSRVLRSELLRHFWQITNKGRYWTLKKFISLALMQRK